MYHPKLKGFFPCLELKWETEMSDQEREAFRNLATLEDKIKLIHRVPFVSSLLDKLVKLNYGEKSKEKSVQNREAGNAQFYAGNFKQAQILYSVAAFKAPKPGPKSNDLALAYANRSTAFQQLHCPRLSLRDADLALAAGYPEEKAFKLYERKGECHTSLSDVDKALDSFRTAIKMITATRELSKDKKEKFIGAIEKKMEKVKGEMNRGNGSNNNVKPGNNGTTDEHENHDDDDDEMAEEEDNDLSQLIKSGVIADPADLIVNDVNVQFPSFHSSIEIRYEEGRGRYAVASKDIDMGTIIIRETPLTFALNPDKYGTHCQHCFKMIRGVVPCPDCTWVCFCSSECLTKAQESYHKYECGINKLLLVSGLNCYPYLALRLVTIEGLNRLLALKSDLENRSEKAGTSCNMNEVYLSADFRTAYNLMAHEGTITDEMWRLRTFVAVFLLKCLKQAEFFKDDTSKTVTDGLTENEIFVGAVLLQLLNVMPCNCHDISEFVTPVDAFVPGYTKVSLGSGLYASVSLLNHSCSPSYMRCNKGRDMICAANKKILKGEEISENYGLMYTVENITKRQNVLKDHYKFECICVACTENWPSLVKMKSAAKDDPDDKKFSRFPGIRCKNCSKTIRRSAASSEPFNPILTCLACGETTDVNKDIPLKELKKAAANATALLLKGQWTEGMEHAIKVESLTTKYFAMPVLEVVDVQIAIWKSMWLRYGSMRLTHRI